MIGSLMILSSALFSKSKNRRPMVQPEDAYRREDCALQCHSLEQERENAKSFYMNWKTEHVITQSKKRGFFYPLWKISTEGSWVEAGHGADLWGRRGRLVRSNRSLNVIWKLRGIAESSADVGRFSSLMNYKLNFTSVSLKSHHSRCWAMASIYWVTVCLWVCDYLEL